jgi:ribosome-associated protein
MKNSPLKSTSPQSVVISPGFSIPLSEIGFRSSRSGGPGGQNVNKVESRVELMFDVKRSGSLSSDRREKIAVVLSSRIDSNGILHLTSQKSRSQWQNKEYVLAEFCRLLKAAIKPSKKRVHTHPSKAVKEKRLKEKKKTSEKKKARSAVSIE